MPVFKVFRTKRFMAQIEAATSAEAYDIAEELTRNEWIKVDDRVSEVVGLDGAAQRFEESERPKRGRRRVEV